MNEILNKFQKFIEIETACCTLGLNKWAIFHFSCLGSAKFIEEKQKYGFFLMHVALPFVMSELIIDILAYWKS